MATHNPPSSPSDEAFQVLLHKLQRVDDEPLAPREAAAVQATATANSGGPHRREVPLPPVEFWHHPPHGWMGHIEASGYEALRRHGFAEFPYQELGQGAFGCVTLGFQLTGGSPAAPQNRRLCAIKVQELYNQSNPYNELSAMRGLVHPNIVDYYTHFVVAKAADGPVTAPTLRDRGTKFFGPPTQADPKPNASRYLTGVETLWIVMEFADAGTLKTEVKRFPKLMIPEDGIRYYARQIGSALEYMHSRGISHGDLHRENIMMKYQPDFTKKTLIMDFSLCKREASGSASQAQSFRQDCLDYCTLVDYMLRADRPIATPENMVRWYNKLERSKEAQVFILWTMGDVAPDSMTAVLKRKWFKGPDVPPIPASKVEALKRMSSQLPSAVTLADFSIQRTVRSPSIGSIRSVGSSTPSYSQSGSGSAYSTESSSKGSSSGGQPADDVSMTSGNRSRSQTQSSVQSVSMAGSSPSKSRASSSASGGSGKYPPPLSQPIPEDMEVQDFLPRRDPRPRAVRRGQQPVPEVEPQGKWPLVASRESFQRPKQILRPPVYVPRPRTPSPEVAPPVAAGSPMQVSPRQVPRYASLDERPPIPPPRNRNRRRSSASEPLPESSAGGAEAADVVHGLMGEEDEGGAGGQGPRTRSLGQRIGRGLTTFGRGIATRVRSLPFVPKRKRSDSQQDQQDK